MCGARRLLRAVVAGAGVLMRPNPPNRPGWRASCKSGHVVHAFTPTGGGARGGATVAIRGGRGGGGGKFDAHPAAATTPTFLTWVSSPMVCLKSRAKRGEACRLLKRGRSGERERWLCGKRSPAAVIREMRGRAGAGAGAHPRCWGARGRVWPCRLNFCFLSHHSLAPPTHTPKRGVSTPCGGGGCEESSDKHWHAFFCHAAAPRPTKDQKSKNNPPMTRQASRCCDEALSRPAIKLFRALATCRAPGVTARAVKVTLTQVGPPPP